MPLRKPKAKGQKPIAAEVKQEPILFTLNKQSTQLKTVNMHKIRIIENFHIVLWLIKDTCWLIQFRIGGVIMIVPTLFLAFYIAWKTRHSMSLLLPNLAVCFWISANVIWMLGEFFDFNHVPYALVSFCLGIVAISVYLLRYRHDTETLI